jgi:hypothetical protein
MNQMKKSVGFTGHIYWLFKGITCLNGFPKQWLYNDFMMILLSEDPCGAHPQDTDFKWKQHCIIININFYIL